MTVSRRILAIGAVALALLVVVFANVHLVYVSLQSQPDCVAHLKPGTIVILDSTTYPGTTDELLQPMLESTGLKVGTDFFLAFSPEREDPANPDSKVASIPKVVGGLTPACLEKAVAVYQHAIKTVVPVSSCRVAEAAKLLTRRNSMTAPYLWLLCGLGIAPAMLWWNDSHILLVFIVLFAVSYIGLYASVLRFKSPRWMLLRGRR